MSNSHPNSHDGSRPNEDNSNRLSPLHVDDRFPMNHPHPHQIHHSPNPTGFTPSLNNRGFAYPDPIPMDVYNFFQPQLNGLSHLEPPFSPQLPAGLGGFGYPPPIPGDMAGIMQNQFEYGQVDPYGVAHPGILNHGLGLGMDVGMKGAQMGGGAVSQKQNGYRGGVKVEEARSPVRANVRPATGMREQNGMSGQQGRKMSDGMMSPPPQGFGDYAGGGAGYWPTNNGAFVERSKKPQIDTTRSTSLRAHGGFNTFTPNLAPIYPVPAIRSAFNHFTPHSPSLHPHLVPVNYGPPYVGPILRYQGARPRRFDDQPRSALLEDYRLNKTDKNWGLPEIFGHIIEFSGDQHGSRLIQTKLEQATDQDRQTMYNEILPNALTLMTDVFGNYVVQKFFDFGTEEQVRGLAGCMRGQVWELSMQMYGCRVVQKAFDKVQEGQKLAIIAELDGKIVECVKNANANHVIQRIIQSNPPKFVPDAFLGHAQDLSIHSFGCRVLQKAVEHLPDGHKQDLLEELQACAKMLIEDAFGNYVVQSMIIAAGPDHRHRVIKLIRGQVWTLSRHKFASNVVEKAILHADPNDKRELVYELVNVREDGSHRVAAVLRDPFANFVLQTCLKSAERSQRQQLLDLVVPVMNTIRHTPPGKRLDAITIEMQSDGFSIPLISPIHSSSITLVSPNLSHLPLNPLRQSFSALSADGTECTEVGDESTDASESRLWTPAMLMEKDGRLLRPTASAPPRSDGYAQAAMAGGEVGGKGKARAITPTGSLAGVKMEQEDLIDLLK